MDIMELGAIGELVGGVAVIATLVYLAVQLRQTKEMMRMEAARTASKEYGAFLYQLMDAEQMALFRQGFDHFDKMNPNDQARLHCYLTAAFMAAQSTYQEEGIDFFVTLIRSPGFASWWAITKVVFTDDFARHVDEVALAQKDAPLAPEMMPWYRWADGASNVGA